MPTGLHRERREHERQRSAYEQTDQSTRGHNGEVIEGNSSANLLDLYSKCKKRSEPERSERRSRWQSPCP